MDIDLNKVLMIAYHFPPDAAVGALRSQKFAKYLPEFGWEPYVLTIKEKHLARKDKGRLADVCNVQITRISVWRTPLQIIDGLRSMISGNSGPSQNAVKGAGSTKGDVGNNEPRLNIVKRFFIAINLLPDHLMYWIIPATIAGLRIIRKEKIGHIYVSSAPLSANIVGCLLALLTGAKLVIDFRDPWLLTQRDWPMYARTRITDWLHTKMEKLVVHRADALINVSARLSNALMQAYPNESAGKFHTITNGFDSSDFTGEICIPVRRDKFVISYLGSLYLHRSPDVFFRVVGDLVKEGIFSPDQIEIQLIGAVVTADGVPVREMAAEHGLTACLKLLDNVSYSAAVRTMSESHVLLLLAQQQYYGVPAKTFDYLAAGRSILALNEGGDVSDLLTGLKAGIVVDPYNLQSMAEAIKFLYQDFLDHTDPVPDRLDISIFERKFLTNKLATILESLS
jgi:glycosyltransferase involved in cell wall biosynthesis